MSKTMPDIQRLLDLQRLLQRFNEIDRVVHRKHGDGMRQENDTEHSYNLTMTAWYLAPSFPNLDCNQVIKYALVHDLVEIHAGDTFAFASEALLGGKHEREQAAARQLQTEWADFPEIHVLIKEYETRANPEARFIYALDKIMPVMQIYIHEGYSWKQHKVTAKMIRDNKADKIALSPEVQPYFEALFSLLLQSPDIIKRG